MEQGPPFGVILIQTKGAKGTDRTTITYSNNFAWDGATFLPKFPDVPSQLRAALEGKANANNYEVELFGMYFDKLLPLAEKWKQQNGGKQDYREMRQYVDDNNIGDYTIIDKTPYYYADWDINKDLLQQRRTCPKPCPVCTRVVGQEQLLPFFGLRLQGRHDENTPRQAEQNTTPR